MSFIRQHKVAVLWSLVLHVAVTAGLLVGIPLPERPRVPIAAAPIQGTIVDTAALERNQKAREEAARQALQRQQREERQRREAVEQQRQAQQREEQRVAAEQRAREQAEQQERERVAAEKAAQERREQQARADREREAQAQREREAAEKRAREQAEQRRRQQQAESELQQQLAREAEQNAARDAGLLDQYISMIENRIKQHWDRPLSARPGIDCVVNVVQLPSGDVMSAKVASCNGDDAVRRSIERAVMDASPLPKPPNAALFERNLVVNFKPDE
jgi:colicin import membrane protein